MHSWLLWTKREPIQAKTILVAHQVTSQRQRYPRTNTSGNAPSSPPRSPCRSSWPREILWRTTMIEALTTVIASSPREASMSSENGRFLTSNNPKKTNQLLGLAVEGQACLLQDKNSTVTLRAKMNKRIESPHSPPTPTTSKPPTWDTKRPTCFTPDLVKGFPPLELIQTCVDLDSCSIEHFCFFLFFFNVYQRGTLHIWHLHMHTKSIVRASSACACEL